MPEEERFTETATLPPDADNVRRPPAIKDTDEFLPLPGHICIIYPPGIPWHRRLMERIAGWFSRA
jgi:hypothetical protein